MMQQRIFVYGLILALLASLGGCVAAPDTVGQTAYWPGDLWRTSTPEEQGLDSSLIQALLQEIQTKHLNIHSLLIIRHGYLVTEVYFPPYQPDMRHPVFSTTKSVTSALVGKALQEGYIKSLQQKILDFFPDIARDVTDQKLKDITLEHLLTMSAGYNTNTLPNLVGKDASFDTIRQILTYDSVLLPPGTSFFYDPGLPHLLSAVVQKSTGMTLQAYAEQKLFGPLGITDFTWDSDPQGITNGSTGLTLRPRDLAKLGYLFLHQGEWNGTQVLPKDWVATSTAKHIETKDLMNAAEDDGYGYLWWIDAFGGYSAHGFGGQYTFVIPPLDMVIVFTGGLPDSQFPVPNQLVKAYLLPAAKMTVPLTPNAQAVQALKDRIQSIEQGASAFLPLPKMAQAISGKTFQIMPSADSASGFQTVALTFSGGETYQSVTRWPGGQIINVNGSLKHVFQLNQVQFVGPQWRQDLLVAVRGYWQDEGTFVEEYVQNLKTDIDLITQKYAFSGDKVIIDVKSSMGLFTIQVVGKLVQ